MADRKNQFESILRVSGSDKYPPDSEKWGLTSKTEAKRIAARRKVYVGADIVIFI